MKIRPRQYRNGNTAWQLDLGIINGARCQRSFETKRKAEEHAAEVLGERRQYGEVAVAMCHPQRLRYAEAEAKLTAAGITLEEALQWALQRAAHSTDKPLGELWPRSPHCHLTYEPKTNR